MNSNNVFVLCQNIAPGESPVLGEDIGSGMLDMVSDRIYRRRFVALSCNGDLQMIRHAEKNG